MVQAGALQEPARMDSVTHSESTVLANPRYVPASVAY